MSPKESGIFSRIGVIAQSEQGNIQHYMFSVVKSCHQSERQRTNQKKQRIICVRNYFCRDYIYIAYLGRGHLVGKGGIKGGRMNLGTSSFLKYDLAKICCLGKVVVNSSELYFDVIYYVQPDHTLGDIIKIHFTVHRCIAMNFSKKSNLVINRVQLWDKKSRTFVNRYWELFFWMDHNNVKHPYIEYSMYVCPSVRPSRSGYPSSVMFLPHPTPISWGQ